MTGTAPCRRYAPWRVALAVATFAGGAFLAFEVEADQADYDCTDFDSRDDAQVFYEEAGGPLYDPFNLDDDGDGIACEEWERGYEQTRAGEGGINGLDGRDRDCADFDGQGEAQHYFVLDGGSARANVDHLDANHNGIACEPGEPG